MELTSREKVIVIEQNQEIALCLKGLKKDYGSKQVLKGIDLTVQRGQIIGYIGPNGAGKSTTIKIILGLEGDYSGKVEIFGEEVTEQSVDYKRKIGYVPEVAELYDNLTAREYLTFVGELYGLDFQTADQKAQQLMKVFGLEEVYHARIASYSKGMRQKVLIISSLIHNPDLLFLDEPLSGLDANSVMVFKEILAVLAAQGKTIFYSSHIMDVVEKISNRIILINDGNIVADGSFDELKQQNHEGTLEQIFNQLTGFNEHKALAEEFVAIVQGV
ncbi:ABC transporter ATP-binding protein [Neobacillus sp. OS1-32]|jgi:ABC-2 type transport system ATP-binding protein|uniref:ABC transporter ATP-binding protein n=1 Tax=Neobacillus paridis TaxID=2803862 RepID=A0ABS1TTS8_9BACI|nr:MULTISPECIES: ABC transporter ATP-binding protein [Neobacillus]MBL4954715.1 ABC transporter ATP-binding protein [Neobacillus paridis]WML29866.1 ABC transporter ATP-binding protein [Neobacillus sp. OS1-32]